jgi:hypothetical protein
MSVVVIHQTDMGRPLVRNATTAVTRPAMSETNAMANAVKPRVAHPMRVTGVKYSPTIASGARAGR